MKLHRFASLVVCVALSASCRNDARHTPARETAAAVDSTYAPAAMIATFRAKMGPRPEALGVGAATHRDTLVARYVRAVEGNDTVSLDAMRMSVGEFAWFYYADSPMAQPPYELDPDVMWMQMSAQSARGLTRMLQRFGGHPLGNARWACEPPATRGTLTLHACTLSFRPSGASADLTLPLTILERDGRFKFVGYGNQL